MRTITTDVLVVGGGLAALRAAYDARRAGAMVAVAVKGKLGRSGASAMTSAGYSSFIQESDSSELHFADTLRGGHGLNDEGLVRILTREAPERLRELVALGAPLVTTPSGAYHVHPSGDHSVPRTVGAANHVGLDFTQPLARAVLDAKCIVLEKTPVVDLIWSGDEIAGAVAIDNDASELVLISAHAVIVGTGGGGRLFTVTSNPNDATGDGYGLVLRAGGELRDMEFIQFYPWRCIVPFERSRMPIQPSTFVFGGRLYNARGDRFMLAYDPERGEATTRDVAARGIYDQLRLGLDVRGGVRLDVSALTLDAWIDSNPRPAQHFLARGQDFHDEEMIVSPEAHFFMGGAVVGSNGQTALPGLFVVGETAGGLHGANRLDSNALPETQVFGARAGRAAAARAGSGDLFAPVVESDVARRWRHQWAEARGAPPRPTAAAPYAALMKELQNVLWEDLGIVRDAPRLAIGLTRLSALRTALQNEPARGGRELHQKAQLEGAVLLAEVCLLAAAERQESRGAHYRLDFPEQDDDRWRRVILASLEDGDVRLETRSLESTGAGM